MTETLAAGTYDNRFEPDSVYGHALDLLAQYRTASADGGVHLDVGCGYGRIAEVLSHRLGLAYIGVDQDRASLDSLSSRGFETHQLRLGSQGETLKALRSALRGRKLASISMLDTLEHLVDGFEPLRAIALLAAEHSALAVMSVPNFAHRDIAAKLLLGRLDVTDVGLLDHTHTRTFTAKAFDAELRAAGLHKLAEKDTRRRVSDQHFPEDHSLLATGTDIGALLRRLRDNTDPAHADVLQFVWLCVPGPVGAERPWAKAYEAEVRPFLSVVIRTQGKRPHTLREALLSLHGQTDRDVEIIVVGHKLSPAKVKLVERIIDDQPVEMRRKTRLMRVEDGGRTRPLNVGFAAAEGRYIAILDDDDIPFAHWAETFRALHEQGPGRMLRAACVRQLVCNVTVQSHVGLRSEGSPERVYPSNFDILEHLRVNHTPPVTVAFPRGAFHDLGLRFDEALTTTEDWDFIMRVAMMVGTQSSPAVTSIYRWWSETGESSRSDHDQQEWDRNYLAVVSKMDASPLLLPDGSAGRLRYLLDAHDRLEIIAKEHKVLLNENASLRLQLEHVHKTYGTLESWALSLHGQVAEVEECLNVEREKVASLTLSTKAGQAAEQGLPASASTVGRSPSARARRSARRVINTVSSVLRSGGT